MKPQQMTSTGGAQGGAPLKEIDKDLDNTLFMLGNDFVNIGKGD